MNQTNVHIARSIGIGEGVAAIAKSSIPLSFRTPFNLKAKNIYAPPNSLLESIGFN